MRQDMAQTACDLQLLAEQLTFQLRNTLGCVHRFLTHACARAVRDAWRCSAGLQACRVHKGQLQLYQQGGRRCGQGLPS